MDDTTTTRHAPSGREYIRNKLRLLAFALDEAERVADELARNRPVEGDAPERALRIGAAGLASQARRISQRIEEFRGVPAGDW